MGCSSIALMSSPVDTGSGNLNREQNGLRRSKSTKDLHNEAGLRRCHSENHISYNMSCICASAMSKQPKLKYSRSTGVLPFHVSGSIIPASLRSFLFEPETSKDMSLVEDDIDIDSSYGGGDRQEDKVKRANWVERLLEIRSHWRNRQHMKKMEGDGDIEKDENGECDGDDGGCEIAYSSEEDEEEEDSAVKYDRELFSELLVQVPLPDIRLFSQLAFLCNIAYVIPMIRAQDLMDIYRLKFVTSSIEKKAEAAAMKAKFEGDSTRIPVAGADPNSEKAIYTDEKRSIRPSVAYDIAVSAATYMQSRAKGIMSLGLEAQEQSNQSGEQVPEEGDHSPHLYKSEVAAYMAASTMTAVVAAGEKEKQAAAQDLQSLHSSPCDWFICDDLYTRYFVIQGSDSLASWQANLLFEPTKFEDTDGIVHRGIYEAAKGIFDQFLPEIITHLEKYGARAKFQFAGHSLGGSLALLVSLMLLTKKILRPRNLQPVVTFGSPFVLCGGHKILNQLGVDENLFHCVMMHRDIVPRAFACSYPSQISVLLKRVNGSFRSHPCLIRNKLLYSPMGKLFILQPDEKTSPPHPLLPPASDLYVLDKNKSGFSMSALRAFLNCPHPIDTLSDPRAYGSEGTILRDHDSSNYLEAMNGVLRQYMKKALKRAKSRRNQLWPLLNSPPPHSWTHRNNLSSNKEIMTGV